jgi:hypothetical protein
VITIALITFAVPVARLLLLVCQMRWLLRAYRRERDRHVAGYRVSRPRLLAAAVLVVVSVSLMTGVSGVRPIATGALLVMTLYQAAQRRWFSGCETAAQA